MGVDASGGAIYAAGDVIVVDRTCSYDCGSHQGQFLYQYAFTLGSLTVADSSLAYCRNNCDDGGDQRGNFDLWNNVLTHGRNVNFSSAWARGDGSCLSFQKAPGCCHWNFGIFLNTEGPTAICSAMNELSISYSVFLSNRNSRDDSPGTLILLDANITCRLSNCRFKDNKFRDKKVNILDAMETHSISVKNCDFDVSLPFWLNYKELVNNREKTSFELTICAQKYENHSPTANDAKRKLNVGAIAGSIAAIIVLAGVIGATAVICPCKKKSGGGQNARRGGNNGFGENDMEVTQENPLSDGNENAVSQELDY
jgi:hypothetical protein